MNKVCFNLTAVLQKEGLLHLVSFRKRESLELGNSLLHCGLVAEQANSSLDSIILSQLRLQSDIWIIMSGRLEQVHLSLF